MAEPKDLTALIEVAVREWADPAVWAEPALSAKEINSGQCDDFAYYIVGTLCEQGEWRAFVVDDDWFTVEGREDPGAYWRHAWIYFEGKHYDAEVPEGVEDWLQLPFFIRFKADPSDYGGNFPDFNRADPVEEEHRKLQKARDAIVRTHAKIEKEKGIEAMTS